VRSLTLMLPGVRRGAHTQCRGVVFLMFAASWITARRSVSQSQCQRSMVENSDEPEEKEPEQRVRRSRQAAWAKLRRYPVRQPPSLGRGPIRSLHDLIWR